MSSPFLSFTGNKVKNRFEEKMSAFKIAQHFIISKFF